MLSLGLAVNWVKSEEEDNVIAMHSQSIHSQAIFSMAVIIDRVLLINVIKSLQLNLTTNSSQQ